MCYLIFLELWLNWLQDEIKLLGEKDSKDDVSKLFERAVGDYICEFL